MLANVICTQASYINVDSDGVSRFFKTILRIFQDDLEGYFVFIGLPGYLVQRYEGKYLMTDFYTRQIVLYVSEVESNWPRSWHEAEI